MTIKDYEIIKQIGSGGMGAIYLARDPRLDRLVAIKKTRIPGNLEKDVHNEIIQRFYREARAVANLNHPNIVTVYDLGEDDQNNECFMVMEYLEGRPVDSIIDEQKKLSINLAMKIGIQTCEALSYLHQKNIIHRDIKPANLMYCNNGMVKLMDFGLVRIEDNLDLTRAGTLLGSVLYMSPEQIKNPKNIDHQVDIYAFGVSLYQIMSGHFPYDGESVWEVIRKVTMEEPTPLSKVNPEINITIEKIIMKAINKDKEKRYTNISDLQHDLANYNNFNTQTIISPLSYARGTGKLPSLENVSIEKTQITDNPSLNNFSNSNNEMFIKTQISSSELQENIAVNSYPHKQAYKPDNYFNQFKPIENKQTEIKSEFVEKPIIKEEIVKAQSPSPSVSKDTLSNFLISREVNQDKKSLIYPSFESLSKEKEESKNTIKYIDEKLESEIANLEKIINQLSSLNENVQSESELIYSELKSMITQYNINLKANSNIDLKEAKRKIDYKKLNKNSKDNDILLIKDKLLVYSKLLSAKKIRSEINNIISNFIDNEQKDFFNTNSFLKITENQAENFKEIILKELNSFKRLDTYISKLSKNVDTFKALIAQKNFKEKSIGKIIRLSVRNSFVEVNLSEECENNLLIEIDTDESEIIFTYCQITRNDRPVPKFQSGDLIHIHADIFDESLKDKIKSNTNIYKSKSRIYKKELIELELEEDKKILELIQSIKPSIKNKLDNSFEQIVSLFSEIDLSEELSQAKKQLLTSNINKIKKAVIELKKDLEPNDEILNQYIKYINPILLSINKYPVLLKNYDNEIRNKREQRKKLIHSILMQINKGQTEYLRQQKDMIIKSIDLLKENNVPESMIKFLKFYMLYKAKLPTAISKNQIIEVINNEKNLLSTIEIDWVCKLLSLNYTKEKGFFIKLNS